ncbi:hypothetical protein [Noviherbaspirillum autotrophicum]|uniref:hypothetical protein n=1 Tax=Noviherbaspirillum autotrophicum TaxID=709839 RepID=UPI000693610D|nr:hypothetical protein [Noviherbaspirillum autotrophicum]
MSPIRLIELRPEALLHRYRQHGSYTDCYYMDVPRLVSFKEYVATFYTTSLFKIERHILALLACRPSSDAGALELAGGMSSNFAVWSVEDRKPDQLLLRDFLGRTRSWLMAEPLDARATRLYFGSAVVPLSHSSEGVASFGFAFHAFHGFHHLYTKALMSAARSRLAGTSSEHP